MPLTSIGSLLRGNSGRDLMDALLPVPNTSYGKVGVGVGVDTSRDTGSDNDDVDDAPTTTTMTLNDDASPWSRTRMQHQERIDRTYANMAKTASLLRVQTGTQDLRPLISAYPSVFLLDSERQILPVCCYMMGGLGIWKE
uniref:Uncharacterized protein n=1 Tax=Pseudo-nitzschia australis TaxID=44445 RepID=A0A6V0AER0_9STRA